MVIRKEARWLAMRACTKYDFDNGDPRVTFIRAWVELELILVKLGLLIED